MSARVGKP